MTLASFSVTEALKWLAVAALVSVLFVGGCYHGQKRLSDVAHSLASCQKANEEWASAAEEREAALLKQAEEAEAKAEMAQAGALVLAKRRNEAEKLAAESQRKLENALGDPKCNEVLELMVCETVPIP